MTESGVFLLGARGLRRNALERAADAFESSAPDRANLVNPLTQARDAAAAAVGAWSN